MAYPRECPACGMGYASWGPGAPTPQHVTVWRREGGAPSPWRQDMPGRVLGLRCLGCGSVFTWDYFAPTESGKLGRVLRVDRQGPQVA